MSKSKLLKESDRAHFMTRRFDRIFNTKVHMQTLCGLAHYDYNMAGAYSYEQVFYSYNPKGRWTNQHQMSIAGKRSDFTKKDLLDIGENQSLPNVDSLYKEVKNAIKSWPDFAKKAGLNAKITNEISSNHRLDL